LRIYAMSVLIYINMYSIDEKMRRKAQKSKIKTSIIYGKK